MMHKILLWMVCCCPLTVAGRQSVTIFVSPEAVKSISADGRKVVVGNLERACQLASDYPDDTVVINVAEGVHRLLRPIQITHPRTAPLRFVGQGVGRTTVSGARVLPPFEEVSPTLWKVNLEGHWAECADIQQLYVGGRRAVPARTPNQNLPLWRTGCVSQTVVDSVPSRKAPRKGLAVQALKLNSEAYDALSALTGSVENVKISFLHAWDMTRRYIETFNPVDSAVYVTGNLMKPWNAVDRESQFFIEGDVSFVDSAGEWCVDRESHVLYYYPRPDEHPDSVVAEVPLLSRLVCIEGVDNATVSDVSFCGLSLMHTRYTMPRRGDEPLQAASRTGAAVEVRYAKDIIIRDCEIAHTGGYGVWFGSGCRNSIAERCMITDLGAGGVKIGGLTLPDEGAPEMTSHIELKNCIVKSGGRIFPTGTGVLLTHASDCRIEHNDITDFYYTGISAGWVWGYGYSPSRRNYIGYNHVHHLGWGMLSDMGGIYTLGRSDSTLIERNVVHHVYSYSYGGWGIYADEGSQGITVRSNLVHDCKFSAFHQHYGRDNVVANNIFANQMRVQLESSSDEPHTQFSYTSNIVYHTSGAMYGLRWDKSRIDRHHNLYWYAGEGGVRFGGRTLQQWQHYSGSDTGSIEADPQMRDIEAGDYVPTAHDALEAIGFVVFDPAEAGVIGTDEWKRAARLDSEALKIFDRLVEYHESNPAPELPLPVVEPKP